MTILGKLPYGFEAVDDPNDTGRVLRNNQRILEEQLARLANAMEKDPLNLEFFEQQSKLTAAIAANTRLILALDKQNAEKVENLSDDEKLELSIATIKELPVEKQREAAAHLSRSAAASGREQVKNDSGTHAGRFAAGDGRPRGVKS